MCIEDYIASSEFILFQDETLLRNACEAVEHFLKMHTPAEKAQLYSIPAVIQAAGLQGLKDLAENQRKKNTKEKNKEFWTFILSLLFDMPGISRPVFALHAVVQKEPGVRALLQDESSVAEKSKQKQITKNNKKVIEMVIEHVLPTFFEHFNCHYFYRTREGGTP
jgi:hypothetical protein